MAFYLKLMYTKISSRIKELDSLRAIAAISVMLFHYTYGFNHSDTHTFLHKGFMGVELFFVVSGFVIFMTLQNTKRPKQFIVSRFARLYPAYWFSVVLSLIIFSIPFFFNTQLQPSFKVNSIDTLKFFSNLTMFQSYFGIEDIDGAYWTLSVELTFYIVMLLLFITRKIEKVDCYGWIYVILLFLTYKYLKGVDLNYIRYGLFFLSGIIYYNIYNEGLDLKKKHFQYLLLFFTLLLNVKYFYHNLSEQLIVFVIYAVFMLLALHKLEWFSFRPLVFLGQISYSMYLLHENIGSVIFNVLDYLRVENLSLKIITSFIIVALLSYLSYYLFENILRKKIIKALS